MAAVTSPKTAGADLRPRFTPAEIAAVRGTNPSGLHGLVPARCYYDESIYQFEVEHVLKKNWLAVGRWDWAEKPGDYFTLTMFGEPLVIVRDRQNQLHCLVNSCRHRWARVVDEGSGNKSALVCPYHRWTYNLDGTLRAMTKENIPGVDKKDCSLPRLRLEVWEGTIFINFDDAAAPLAPQLAGVLDVIGRFNIGEMRSVGRTTYESTWNYKFSFETGYEAYHHAGVHFDRIHAYAPPEVHEKIALGKIWGIYGGRLPKEFDRREYRFPLGVPPWMSEEEADRQGQFRSIFVAVYPGLITYISPHQISMITVEHMGVARNRASTHIAISPWALERAEYAKKVEELAEAMKAVQGEDTYACEILQAGVQSTYNDRSLIHPRYEPMLPHYHQWLLDQYLNA
jgi:phenylpropionate dioxygenase-like ring-hydroxylating dioxygenase large terminal subunit